MSSPTSPSSPAQSTYGSILIYKDTGTCEASCTAILEELYKVPHRAIEFATSHYLKTASWESRTSLLVLPGGVCSKWETNLGMEGMRKIQKYVQEHSGRLLGICAGGYFISKFSLFETASVKIEKERPFPLFPGKAIGPLKTSSSSSAIAEVVKLYTPDGDSGGVYYQQGCAFSELSYAVSLASYEAPHTGAAIIAFNEGSGTVVGCGPHIEFSAPRTRSPFEPSDVSDLFDKLGEGRAFRLNLWDDVLKALFPDVDREAPEMPDLDYDFDLNLEDSI